MQYVTKYSSYLKMYPDAHANDTAKLNRQKRRSGGWNAKLIQEIPLGEVEVISDFAQFLIT